MANKCPKCGAIPLRFDPDGNALYCLYCGYRREEYKEDNGKYQSAIQSNFMGAHYLPPRKLTVAHD